MSQAKRFSTRLFSCGLLLCGVMGGAASVRSDIVGKAPMSVPVTRALQTAWKAYGQGETLAVAVHLQKALQTARETNDKVGEAIIVLIQSEIMAQFGQQAAARKLGAEGEAILVTLPVKRQLDICHGATLTLRDAGWSERGQKWALRTLEIAEKSGDAGDRARGLHLRGLFSMTSNPQTARTDFESALKLWDEANDPAGKAWTYKRLAEIEINRQDIRQALQLVTLAQASAMKSSDVAAKARMNVELAGVRSALGDHDGNVLMLRQALDVLGELSPTASLEDEISRDINAVLARGYANDLLAQHYAQQGQTLKSQQHAEQATAIWRALGRRSSEASALTQLAWTQLRMGDPKAALETSMRSFALIESLAARETGRGAFTQALDSARAGLAFIQIQNGQLEAAKKTLAQISPTLPHYTLKAQLARASGDTLEEIRLLQSALTQAEHQRDTLAGLRNASMSQLNNQASQFSRLIELLLAQNRESDAFEWAEKLRGRALLDALQNGGGGSMRGLSEEQKKTRTALSGEVESLSAALLLAQMRGDGGARVDEWRTQLREAETKLAVLDDQIAVSNPVRRVLRRTARLEDLAWLPEQTALIEWVALPESQKLVAFVVSKTDGKPTLHTHIFKAPLSEIAEAIEDFALACANPQSRYALKSKSLYQTLLAPLEAHTNGKKSWLISPDGPLWRVPWAALSDESGTFVAQKQTVSLTLGATLAGAQLEISKRAIKPNSPPLLVVANPDFGDATRLSALANRGETARALLATSRALVADSRALVADSRGAKAGPQTWRNTVLTREGQFAPLPGTAIEAAELKKLVPNAQILMGKQSQETAIRAQMSQFRALHFATHGLFNASSPLQSSLVLAAPNDQSDGFLTAREVSEMELNAEMVVLSACDSGQGQQKNGEGLIGLSWAFASAGVPNQIVSNWPVSDAATAALMTEFYRGWTAGTAPAQALQNAMIALQKAPATSHPAFWAPFFLMGR